MYTLQVEVEEPLDPALLMYFSYNNKLNARRLAFLYENIVLHKESNYAVYDN